MLSPLVPPLQTGGNRDATKCCFTARIKRRSRVKKYFYLPIQSNRVISLKFRVFLNDHFHSFEIGKCGLLAKDNARTSFVVDPKRVNYDDSKVVFYH